MKIPYKRIIYSLILSFCLRGGLFSQEQSYANNTTITLGIYNSYSGTIGFQVGQNIINFGGNIRTDSNTLGITVGATTGSSYSLTGAINTITGYGSGNYSVNHTINLPSTDGTTILYGSFLRNTEPYNRNLTIIVDQTAPSQSQIIQPSSNSIVSGNTVLSRTVSTDSGIGLAHYKIHLSLDAGFLGETILLSTGNSIQLGTNDLPIGTIFRYVESVDRLGHSSNSTPSFFHYKAYSFIQENTNSDNGGGGTTTTIPVQNNPTNIPHTGGTTTGNINNTGDIIGGSGTTITGPQPQIELPIEINEEEEPLPTIQEIIPIINNTIIEEEETIRKNTNSNIIQEETISNTNSSSSNNYIIISNSVDNSSLGLKDYLLVNYDILSNAEKGNLILPEQNQSNLSSSISLPRSEIYTGLLYTGSISTGYIEEQISRYEVMTYVTQQNNPIYYIMKLIGYGLNMMN